VEQVSLVGQSGRFFQYLIVARPWFWFLSQTQDCKVFQNQTVLQIIEAVLGDHPIASIDDRMSVHPRKSSCTRAIGREVSTGAAIG